MADEESIVLGIDLGTTFSAMSYVNHYGKAEIIPNAEGFATTPSVVHFYEEEGCVVGDEAVKMVVIDPENVVRFIKRSMGEEDFVLDFWDRAYTPQEVSALILKKLKEDAEQLLGKTITDAIITVPAYFNSAQRGATAEAGAIAGLNVLSIINEPTAAAIAYGLDNIGEDRKLLVFDLGGGTFDVTCMHIRGTRLTTIASDGNAELGGKDWDDRLLNYVAEEFVKKHDLDPRDDPAPYQELYERCLHAKISLSTRERAVIPVNYRGKRMVVPVKRVAFEEMTEDLVEQCEDTANLVLETAKWKWSDLDDVLLVGGSTRMPMIREALKRLAGRGPAANVNPDECVATGAGLAGVFRHRPNHPALQQRRKAMVDKARNKQPVARVTRVEDDTADDVTQPGASVRAVHSGRPAPTPRPPNSPAPALIGLAYGGHIAQQALKVDNRILPPVTIEDCTTHPLGIIVLDRSRKERVVELIPAGTQVPHEVRGRFAYAYENMTAVRVEVTEGVGSVRDEVTVIGKVELTGLPPRPRGTPIEVIYAYGVDQILSVRVIDIETGRSRAAQIRFLGGMSPDDVKRARDRTRRIAVD
ncbi:MAG: molecular chaperone DnaK [Myxococcota bacterium]|jgi:molecular chaperone DnaK